MEISDDGKLTFKLPTFEGPLDLLLHLIKKNEMDSWNLANNIAHAMSLDFKLYDTKSCEWLKRSRDENQVSLFSA